MIHTRDGEGVDQKRVVEVSKIHQITLKYHVLYDSINLKKQRITD